MCAITKALLIIVNAITLLCGLGIMIVGCYLKVDKKYNSLDDVFNNKDQIWSSLTDFNTASMKIITYIVIAIIVIGAVLAVLSIIGIIGAACESKVLLVIYSIIAGVFAILLLIIGGAGIAYKILWNTTFRDYVTKAIKEDYTGSSFSGANVETYAIDAVMLLFDCCGANNSTDFASATKWTNRTLPNGQTAKAPLACCKFTAQQKTEFLAGQLPSGIDYQCASNPQTANSNYQTGCLPSLDKYLDSVIIAIIVFAVVAGLALIISPILACCLCCAA